MKVKVARHTTGVLQTGGLQKLIATPSIQKERKSGPQSYNHSELNSGNNLFEHGSRF